MSLATEVVDIYPLSEGANCDDLFLQAQLAARRQLRAHPLVQNQYVGTTTIQLHAANYTVTSVRALLGQEAQTRNITGLRFVGPGSGLCNVTYSPEDEGPLLFNDFWINLAFEGISFYTDKPGAIFMQSHTTHYAQRYLFFDVGWTGPWKHILDMAGTNNNSEFSFLQCGTSGMDNAGAFMFIGPDGSDQFLNYYFWAFKHWSTSAPIIDSTKGGHFHLTGVDTSHWGDDLTEPGYLFYLRGVDHDGSNIFSVVDMRSEFLSPFAGVLHCEWPDGEVEIKCDLSSQLAFIKFGDIFRFVLGNTRGPVVNIRDSYVGGTMRIDYGPNAHRTGHRISVNNTQWSQVLTPSEAVRFGPTSTSIGRPTVRFANGCRGGANDYAGVGVAIWDCTVGSRQPVMTREERTVQVNGGAGSLRDGNVSPLAHLPVGAVITDIVAMGPVGALTDKTGGSWILSTTEATPTVIGRVDAPGDLSLGYRVRSELPVPFVCDTRERASIRLTSSGISSSSTDCFLLVKGYW